MSEDPEHERALREADYGELLYAKLRLTARRNMAIAAAGLFGLLGLCGMIWWWPAVLLGIGLALIVNSIAISQGYYLKRIENEMLRRNQEYKEPGSGTKPN